MTGQDPASEYDTNSAQSVAKEGKFTITVNGNGGRNIQLIGAD